MIRDWDGLWLVILTGMCALIALATTIKDLIDDQNNLEYQLRRRIERQQATIHKLEQWIAAIADDHPQIPDWIQQSARSLLAQEGE